ncbi:MAG TPA: hypothetical protein VI753_13050 [Anaerolineales bacterium]|nr:hypothetical protein [Anaerolineales bacterium]
MFNFNFTAADPANDMVMVFACDLIGQVAAAGMRRVRKSVSREEFEGTIYSRFREPRKVAFGLFVDFGGGKMRPGMMEYVQDRHPLGRHSESACAELGGII